MLLALFGLAFFYYGLFSVWKHRSFHSNGWDLGLFNQVIWNTAHGRWFQYSFRDISYAGDHWQPILFLFVPLKWFWAGPEPLLIAQALLLTAAALPLFALAMTVLQERRSAFAIVVAYLGGLGVARAAAFDFHPEAITPLLFFAALWMLVSERRMPFVCLAGALLLVKEDSVLVVLGLAWFAALRPNGRFLGAGVAAGALVYGLIVNLWVLPHFRGESSNPLLERYGYLGDSFAAVVTTCLTRPAVPIEHLLSRDPLMGAVTLLAGVAFIPLLAPRVWPPLLLAAMPPLLAGPSFQSRLELHYLLVPSCVALGTAVMAMSNTQLFHAAGARMRACSAIAVGAFGCVLLLSPVPPAWTSSGQFSGGSHARAARAMLAQIPANAAVSAQSQLVPHLADREHVYEFPTVGNAEYVITDASRPVPSQDWNGGYQACLQALPALGFQVVESTDGLTLWDRANSPSHAGPGLPCAIS